MDEQQNIIKVTITYERAKYYSDNTYKYFPTMENGFIIVRKLKAGEEAYFPYGKYGVIDSNGNEYVPCVYDSCEPINTRYYIVGKDYTEPGLSGDDYSFPKQKYGIYDTVYHREIVPLTMRYISYHEGNNYFEMADFNDKYFCGLLNKDGNFRIYEKLLFGFGDSLEYIYKSVQGTGKVVVLARGFVLKDGDYNTFEDFQSAYYEILDKDYQSKRKK